MREQEKENIETEEAAPEKVEEAISATPPLLEAELKRLSECLAEKTREAEVNYDKFLRMCADLENYKKRTEK
jgi:molecular chaperone GrpE (heat shock protein)